MKEGLIKLTDEKNIFYDSVDKVYRYRMHCPQCGKQIETGRCYDEIEALEGDIEDGIADDPCSAKCSLMSRDRIDLYEPMSHLGMQKDIKDCLSQLTDEQSLERVKGYDLIDVLKALFEKDSDMPFSHLKKPTHEEQIEIIIAMDDGQDALDKYGISYYPVIADLPEEEAKKILKVFDDDGDYDFPHGDYCER